MGMKLPMASLPRPVPEPRYRTPQKTIPQTRAERDALHSFVKAYADEHQLVPPLAMDELRAHTATILQRHTIDPIYANYTAVLLGNRTWHDQLAAVPFERRLLLLPKCLRVEDKCPAPFDEFGLLCKSCGLCSIQELQEEAERLGYAVLVAEGSAIVMAMIETGKIEAVVGVSCLSVLEKAFPYTESAAIPAIAIPLLQDDCIDTTVDLDTVWESIHLTADDKTRRLDLEAVKAEVETIFTEDGLAKLMGPASENPTDRIARDWLMGNGKRWRPFLAVCAHEALTREDAPADAALAISDDLRRVALAVECFHKASLVHDDIEDEDDRRYGEDALHVSHGLAQALNVGDYLLGEGYRLLAETSYKAEIRARLLERAARGHRTLCLGQGAELAWARDPEPLSSLQVLAIFREKTSPAFQVALELGAAAAGADQTVFEVLAAFSDALGAAYQIRDDLDDLDPEKAGDSTGADPDDLRAMRPTLPLAVARERAKGDDKALLDEIWRRQSVADSAAAEARLDRLRAIINDTGAADRCQSLLESYKDEAVRALQPLELDHAGLKGLLRRVVSKIFRIEIKGWCSDFEAQNLAKRPEGVEIPVEPASAG